GISHFVGRRSPFMNHLHRLVALPLVVVPLIARDAITKRRERTQPCGGRFISTQAVDGGYGTLADRVIDIKMMPQNRQHAEVTIPSCKRPVRARLAVRKDRILVRTNR